MYPILKNTIGEFGLAPRKSFKDTLSEGYRFEVNNNTRITGTRAVYFYKEEHSLLVSHILSNRVHVLNLSTGKLRWFDHHGATVRSIQVCNHEIITASWDGKVGVTNFDTLIPRFLLSEADMGRCPNVAISPDLTSIYSLSYDSDKNPERKSNTVRIWNLHEGEMRMKLELPGVHLSDRRCGSCLVSENKLYVISDSGHLFVYNRHIPILEAELFLNDHLQSICFSTKYDMLFTAGSVGNIYQCTSSGERIKQINKAHRCDITDMIIPPNKPDIMISVSFDGTMKIWKLPTLELIQTVIVQGIRLWTVTVANDLIITGGEKGEIWIYDIKNLPEVKNQGNLFFADDSFAFIALESEYFYASDVSIMQIKQKENTVPVEGQTAEYLLNTASDFKLFKNLFSYGNQELIALKPEPIGFLQLMR